MQTQPIAERVKQYFVPGKHVATQDRLHNFNVLNVKELLAQYPLSLVDARVIYPNLRTVTDQEWAALALGLTVEMIGTLDTKLLLSRYPEIFLFSSYCCWGYYHHLQTNLTQDPYFVQRQYDTVINTLAAVGYSQVECESLIQQLHLPEEARALVLKHYHYALNECPQAVYPLNPKVQGATVH